MVNVRLVCRLLVLLSCLVLLQACSTLPKRHNVVATYSSQYDTSTTFLAKLFEQRAAQHPGLTGFHILYDPTEALATRLQLMDKAEKTLDLQYYIWDNDKVGALALESALRAADRGVKVRLLIDDNNSKHLEAAYLLLNQHPNIQVRVFNPYKFRKARALDILLNFNRITRRMHNKTFIVDHQVALIGGRNMSNQYYDEGDSFQFSDMDVLLAGQAVSGISESFDEYWNHDYAYPIDQVADIRKHDLSFEGLRQQLKENWFNSNVQNYLNIFTSSLAFDHWFNQTLQLKWVEATVVKDSADKIKKETPKEQNLEFQLEHLIGRPHANVDLVSAYFVPSKDNIKLIKQLTKNGVEIRVLTNSFKANDVAVVHAFYAKYRKELLENGVKLYEFLPILPATWSKNERIKLFGDNKKNVIGQSRSSLHAKFMALDAQKVFIGSFNFDQRSAYLNTEIGVVLNSTELAKAIHENMDKDLLKFSYQVQLNDKGQLIWLIQQHDGIKTLYSEPYMKWWQKLGLKLVSFLPIKKQM